MVLQRGRPIPVWGVAEPGEKITVRFRSSSAHTTADPEGAWRVDLPAQELGEPGELHVEAGNHLVFTDVLVGEVWLASGQSNMEWSVTRSANAEAEIAAADHPTIRLFKVQRKASAEAVADVEASWSRCAPESVKDFSAVAYYFGRHLSEHLGVPIGLVQSCWGGTRVEAWTDPRKLRETPGSMPLLEFWKKKIEGDANQAANRHAPSALYNGMIAPLVPYAMRGAIWYQGESNASRAEEYRFLFPALLHSWREQWGQGDFPFLFVQLANWNSTRRGGDERNWAELREAQSETLALPNTGMAVTVDIGNSGDIHPKNKQDVGKRLALWALAHSYGRDLVFSGPLHRSIRIDGNEVRVHFEHAAGLHTPEDQPVGALQLAGADRVWHAAQGVIVRDTLVVTSEQVPAPVAVRYAWKDDPQDANLFNGADLPASPFRSDRFGGATDGARL